MPQQRIGWNGQRNDEWHDKMQRTKSHYSIEWMPKKANQDEKCNHFQRPINIFSFWFLASSCAYIISRAFACTLQNPFDDRTAHKSNQGHCLFESTRCYGSLAPSLDGQNGCNERKIKPAADDDDDDAEINTKMKLQMSELCFEQSAYSIVVGGLLLLVSCVSMREPLCL